MSTGQRICLCHTSAWVVDGFGNMLVSRGLGEQMPARDGISTLESSKRAGDPSNKSILRLSMIIILCRNLRMLADPEVIPFI